MPRQAVWGAGRGGNKRSLPREDRSSSSWVGPVGHGGASAESLFDDIVEWLLLTTPVSQTAEVHPRAQTYQHHRNGKRTDRPSKTPVRAPFCSGRSPRKRRSPRPRRVRRPDSRRDTLSDRPASGVRGLPVAKPRDDPNAPQSEPVKLAMTRPQD